MANLTGSGGYPSSSNLLSRAEHLNIAIGIQPKTASMLRVFVTYGHVDYESEAKELSCWLESNGFVVTADFKQSKLMSMNITNWVDEALEESNFVLVCIDKAFKKNSCQYISTEVHEDPDRSYRQYIFNWMQTTIVQRGCLNPNYIPVLIDGAEIEHLPMIFKTTIAYRWPKDKQSLLNRLRGVKRLGPPPCGEAPVSKFEIVR